MNKVEFIDVFIQKLGLDCWQVIVVVENVVDMIVCVVYKGDSVIIIGFGVFEQCCCVV